MARKQPYYGLVIFDREISLFTWEFGSYDRSDVTFERDDYHDKGYLLNDMEIIRFDHCPTSGEVDKLISDLNVIRLIHF